MRQLFDIDSKNYDPNSPKHYRPSVRGIILDGKGNIAMVYSKKFNYYKFPGGGIEGNETHLQTLEREVKEEAGMTLIPESVKEFGEVVITQGKEVGGEKVIFIQHNYYYTCEVEDLIGEQNLDDDEAEAEYELQFVPLDQAIRVNAEFQTSNPLIKKEMVERERRVLEIIKEEKHGHD